MNSADVLADAFGRVKGQVHRVVRGLTPQELGARIDGYNSIAWLVWHLTRIQDDHVADVANLEQRWTDGGWFEEFGLDLDPADTGYGHDDSEVAEVQVGTGDLLTGYYDSVHAVTLAYVRDLHDDDLDVVVDTSWDPPVTLGVRLVSVLSDDLQHVGQAAYVRGIVHRA